MAPTNALGLTTLGTVHTAVSLIAVVAGAILLVSRGEISPKSLLGKIYVWTTLLTALTALGIFQHGVFHTPHVLGVITIVMLAIATVAGYTRVFGRLSRYVETVSYSATFLCHMIPGVIEAATRLPFGNPILSRPSASQLQAIAAVLFLLFLAGAVLQVTRLRRNPG